MKVIASPEFVGRTLMILLRVASLGLTDSLQSDSKLQPGFPNLASLSSTEIELENAIAVYTIVDGTCSDKDTSLMAWGATTRVEWIVVFFVSTFRLLPLTT